MSRKSVNSLRIALNSLGSVNFNDQRPAVARFLMVKDKRNRNPEYGRYTNGGFVKNFFTTDNVV